MDTIDLGTSPTGAGGDTSRQAFTKVNANFVEVLTLIPGIDTESANTFYGGPTTGADAAPTFRAFVADDIPSLSWAKITSGKPTTLAGYGITDAQPIDSDLTAIAALTTTVFGRAFLTQTDAATTKTTLGLNNVDNTSNATERSATATLLNKTLSTGTTISEATMTLGSDDIGDTYYLDAGGLLARLPVANDGDVLTLVAGLPAWASIAPGGGVDTGSVDNAVLRADGTGGSTSQGSALAINDYDSSVQPNVVIAASDSGATDMWVGIKPKGEGGLFFGPSPDGTLSAGDARGTASVDLQLLRTASFNVASGPYSFLGAGLDNAATASYSGVLAGTANSASASGAVVVGGTANQVSGTDSVTGGNTNIVPGNYSAAFGANNNVAADYSFISGSGSTITASYSAAFGIGNTVGGAYSFAVGASNVASGNYSFVSGASSYAVGDNSFATGNASYAGGEGSVSLGASDAIGAYSVASGKFAVANGTGARAHASGNFAIEGDAQHAQYVLRGTTIDNTPTELFVDGDGGLERVQLAFGQTASYRVSVTGVKAEGSDGHYSERCLMGSNIIGTATQHGTTVALGSDVGSISVYVDASISGVTNSLVVTVTGIFAETWRWVAYVEATEIGHSL